MKEFEPKYRRRHPIPVCALRWTKDVTVADLNDFCDGLVIANDVKREFKVYDETTGTWHEFDYGDWIVDDNGLHPTTHDRFVRVYEEVPDEPEP